MTKTRGEKLQHVNECNYKRPFFFGLSCRCVTVFNLLTTNVNYNGHTTPLTSKVAFYIFIQQT